MAPPAAPTIGIWASAGGVLAASPLGVNVETIAIGTLFSVVGMFGRFAFDIQKSIETGSKIKLLQALGWVGSGLIGAPFLTVVWVMLLRAVGAQTDAATVLGLLFLGFTGPKGVTWMLGLVVDLIGRAVPGHPPPPKPEAP